MYIAVQYKGTTIVAGLDRVTSIREAKRLAIERQKPIGVVDTDTGETLYTARPEVATRRKAHQCPAQCHGAYAHQHAIHCRPARPRCRWRRKANGLCHCHAYHYPHRDGSGMCGDDAAYEKHLRTPRYRVA